MSEHTVSATAMIESAARGLVFRNRWEGSPRPDPKWLMEREWLVTNGLGGYASGTISGICTRRYHGYLTAALSAPHGRTVMLNHISEEFRLPGGRVYSLDG